MRKCEIINILIEIGTNGKERYSGKISKNEIRINGSMEERCERVERKGNMRTNIRFEK